MPWAIRKIDDKWVVMNTSTGKRKGTHTSKAKAQRQISILRQVG